MGNSSLKRTSSLLAMLLGFAAILFVVAKQGAHDVYASLLLGGWGLCGLIPLRALPLLPDALSWRILIHRAPSTLQVYWIAWIRQAVSRLLPVMSVGGELLGIRLVMQLGVPAAHAVSSVVVEVFATLVGQYLFVLLGLFCLWQLHGPDSWINGVLIGLLVGLPLIATLMLLLGRGSLFGRLHRLARGLIGREPDLATFAISDEVDSLITRLCADHRRLSYSVLLQLIGMILGCLEVWAAFTLTGGHLSLTKAIVVEALSQTAKHVLFFIPGALGVQEITFMALSPIIGVGVDVGLAASLAKRAIDVIVGVPALVSWQVSERRKWSRRTVN